MQIIRKKRQQSEEVLQLKQALEEKGVNVLEEVYDGFKHVDLSIPSAKIDVEVDGIKHLTNPHQILRDLERGYFSSKDGYATMHIPNEMVHFYLDKIATALAQAVKLREQRIRVHMD